MNSGRDLTYDLFSESEWRIVFHEKLLRSRHVIDPRDPANAAESEVLQTVPDQEQDKLRYLVPVDGWLALIIYPTIWIKNEAQSTGSPIPSLLKQIKTNPADHANKVERGNYPVEIDLDLCRNL
jgi:hypothetical protein